MYLAGESLRHMKKIIFFSEKEAPGWSRAIIKAGGHIKEELMSYRYNLIGAFLLISSAGFAEVVITAQDYAVDSDVVLESAVEEIKSVVPDTAAVIGDSLKYVKDETVTAAEGIASVFRNDPHGDVKRDAELTLEQAWDSSEKILPRDYKLSGEIGRVLMIGATETIGTAVDVRAFFKGIEFPEGTSAYYMPPVNHLFIRQNLGNILRIESVLNDYSQSRKELMGHQVEIEAKFIEIGQKTLDELGFSWRFGSKGGGDAHLFDNLYLPAGQDLLASGLRTAATAIGAGTSPGTLAISKTAGSLRWDLIVTALEQSDDSDVLSAPRVVTQNGNLAIIQVGEEEMIPKAFDVNNRDTSPWIEHTDWELEFMGVELEVTPELREGGLIDLELKPRVKELVGYDDYQAVPSYGYGAYTKADSDLVEVEYPLTASLPYFRIREMETNVTVADGSTVGLGGLIYDKLETFRDKVPVLGSIPYLGRLFRSEGSRSVKRNLMIFVTATQVDINGQKASGLALTK